MQMQAPLFIHKQQVDDDATLAEGFCDLQAETRTRAGPSKQDSAPIS